MANKNRTTPIRKVYNRKILRNILKHQMKTNKIGPAWRALKAEGRI